MIARRLTAALLPMMLLVVPACGPLEATGQYKRHHPRLITQISEGRLSDALAGADWLSLGRPDDPETLFVKAVALARAGRTDEAVAAARRALTAGLPSNRLFAGPRELTAPLQAALAFGPPTPDPSGLIHGPMLGAMTDTAASVWIRTSGETMVDVLATRDGKLCCLGEGLTRASTDFTAVIRLTGLEPATRYEYAVHVDGRLAAEAGFTTLPPVGRPGQFRIAFGGGAGYTPRNERMWDEITAYRPAAMLMLGDNVYVDAPKSPATQRYCYYRRQSRPEWRRLTAHTPIYAIWDDHDFAMNNCLGSAQIDRPTWKLDVWEVFRQNWVNPAYGGGPTRPGCWHDFRIGDVHVIMLDGRYYRTRKTMLGGHQKHWLLDTLKRSDATFKIIASPVAWARGAKPGSRDTWDGYPAEREEIFRFIESNRIEGVFLLSGDRHRSDAWKIPRPNGYDLYEAASSCLTNTHRHASVPGTVFTYNRKCSFGLLTIDTTRPDPALTYDVINIDGEKVRSLTLRRSQLASGVRR